MGALHDKIRKSLHARLGIDNDPVIPEGRLRHITKSQWSNNFERLMRNRLIMGTLRYGLMKDPNKPQYDRIPDIIRRLEEYAETGNLEHLVDGANLCMVEFEEGKHPKRHFSSQDDSQHTGIKK